MELAAKAAYRLPDYKLAEVEFDDAKGLSENKEHEINISKAQRV